MAAKANRETFETIGNMTIVRWFKAGAWSYDLLNADGTLVASIWNVSKGADAWANKRIEGKPGFRPPIIGEQNAVAWLRTLAA